MDEHTYIRRIIEGIRHISNGEYEMEIEQTGTHPELDQIASSINELSDEVIRKTRQLQEKSYNLERQSAQQERILESLQVMVFIVDKETKKIVDINRFAAEKTGLNNLEKNDLFCYRHICTSGKKGVCSLEEKDEEVLTTECIVKDWEGNPIPVMKTVIEIEYKGRPCFLETATDISGLKQKEQVLQVREKELQESKERFEMAVEGSAEGIWDWNLLDNEAFLSEDWRKIIGYANKKPISEFKIFLKKIHPEDRKPFVEKANRFLRGEEVRYEDEFRLDTGFGGYRWILCRGVARRKAGKPIRMAGSLLDVTELKNAEIRAGEANRAKSLFLANMSHEIRTPLNAILGFSSYLNNKLVDPGMRGKAGEISKAGESLLNLINDILDISRIDTGKLQLEYHYSDVRRLSEDMQNLFASSAEENGLELVVNVDDSVPDNLRIDERRLRQVLLNLVGNAIKFTEQGRVIVRLSAVADPSYPAQTILRILVSDTGIGISHDQQQTIFEPFHQSTHVRANRNGGTGLGLALSRRLVEMMGGTIGVTSNDQPEAGPTGSIFTVIIPGLDTEKPGENSRGEMAAGSSPFSSLKGRKVLVVDDIEMNRQLVESYLEDDVMEIMHAADGKEAVEVATSQQPDIILMDIVMPGMGGLEAASILKNDARTRHIPILLVTASLNNDLNEEIQSGRIDGLLHKPVTRQLLFSEIRRLVRPVDEVPPQSGDKNGSGAMLADEFKDMDPAIVAVLPQVVERMESELMPVFRAVKKTFIMSRIRDFAHQVDQFNREYGIPALEKWSEQVQEYVRRFDMLNLPVSLEAFGQIMEQLKTYEIRADE